MSYLQTVSLSRLRKSDDIEIHGYVTYSLIDRRVNDDAVHRFASLVRYSTLITRFNVRGCNKSISIDVWRDLIEVVLRHRLIKQIYFCMDALATPLHATVFAELLRENPNHNLSVLNISCNNNVLLEGFATIFESLQQNKTLQRMALECTSKRSKKHQDTESGRYRLGRSIGEFMQQSTTITEIYLNENYWGDTVATSLAFGLQTNTSLTIFNYTSNNMDNKGAIAIAKALRYNKHLKHLALSGNQIGDDGAIAFAESLTNNNRTLESLYVGRNCISKVGLQALANALKYNTSLHDFNCYRNQNCTDLDVIIFLHALQYNSTLRRLEIEQESTTPKGKFITHKEVSEVLEYNDTIMRISCSHPLLEDKHEALLKIEESSSPRVAPKKGTRVRNDIYAWLVKKWVEHTDHTNIKCENNNQNSEHELKAFTRIDPIKIADMHRKKKQRVDV